MKILRRKSDNFVVTISDRLEIKNGCLYVNDVPAPNAALADLEIIETTPPPEYIPGGYTWTAAGGWSRTSEGDAALDEKFVDEKNKKQQQINALFERNVNEIKSGILQAEIDTFSTQEKEALAYQNDSSSPTPLLSGLSSVRGISVAELTTRVLAHADAYKAAMAQAMGKKHAYEDQLKLAETLDDINAIIVE